MVPVLSDVSRQLFESRFSCRAQLRVDLAFSLRRTDHVSKVQCCIRFLLILRQDDGQSPWNKLFQVPVNIWVKRDQLDVTCFIIYLFNAQHVSDVNTSILRSLRPICRVISWVVLLWFDVCWCYVVVWLGWCGIHMQASACIRIPHRHSQTTT